MAFTPSWVVTVTYKASSGTIETTKAVSTVSAAAAQGLMTAQLNLMSGASVLSVSSSAKLDPAGYALGHADSAEEATITLIDPNTGKASNHTFDNVSLAVKNATANDGSIDLANLQVIAFKDAYNTATGKAYTLRAARFS